MIRGLPCIVTRSAVGNVDTSCKVILMTNTGTAARLGVEVIDA